MVIKDRRVKICSEGEVAELIIPPHPQLYEYPEWLTERAVERLPEYKDAWPGSGAVAVRSLIGEKAEGGWLDHWGTSIYGGRQHLVSEPYHMNRERIESLLSFCDALGLKFNIQSSGHHYPTLTMRIFVWPKEWPIGDHFCQEDEGYADQAPSDRECGAPSAVPVETPEGDAEGGFAQERDLRDFLAKNLHILENGMTLWPLAEGESALEFPVGGGHRRIDILARDRSRVPTVIELKVSRGHEKTGGQVLYYRARVKEILNVERVRIVIVAREISPELRAAVSELGDLSLFEYRLSMTLQRV